MFELIEFYEQLNNKHYRNISKPVGGNVEVYWVLTMMI